MLKQLGQNFFKLINKGKKICVPSQTPQEESNVFLHLKPESACFTAKTETYQVIFNRIQHKSYIRDFKPEPPTGATEILYIH